MKLFGFNFCLRQPPVPSSRVYCATWHLGKLCLRGLSHAQKFSPCVTDKKEMRTRVKFMTNFVSSLSPSFSFLPLCCLCWCLTGKHNFYSLQLLLRLHAVLTSPYRSLKNLILCLTRNPTSSWISENLPRSHTSITLKWCGTKPAMRSLLLFLPKVK